jgi:hypothetical protein
MTEVRETRSRHEADITASNHRYAHEKSFKTEMDNPILAIIGCSADKITFTPQTKPSNPILAMKYR